MLLSQLRRVIDGMDGRVVIELPNTDEMLYLRNGLSVKNFILEHGDVEVVVKAPYQLSVPAFREGREKFSKAKQIECNRWGCE